MKTDKESRQPSSAHVWSAAEQFYKAGECLMDSNLSQYPWPIVMNFAFSAELALKANEVSKRQGKNQTLDDGEGSEGLTIISPASFHPSATGHDLLEVFGKLTVETKNDLVKAFAEATGEHLIPLLERCKDYFVNVRYTYESPISEFDSGSIQLLARGLLDATRQIGLHREAVKRQ